MILKAGMPTKPVLVLCCALSLVAAVPATVAHAGEGIFLDGQRCHSTGACLSGVASPRTSYWSYMNPRPWSILTGVST